VFDLRRELLDPQRVKDTRREGGRRECTGSALKLDACLEQHGEFATLPAGMQAALHPLPHDPAERLVAEALARGKDARQQLGVLAGEGARPPQLVPRHIDFEQHVLARAGAARSEVQRALPPPLRVELDSGHDARNGGLGEHEAVQVCEHCGRLDDARARIQDLHRASSHTNASQ